MESDFDKGGKHHTAYAAVFNYHRRIQELKTQEQWDMAYDVPANITPFEAALIEVVIREMKGEIK